MNEPGLSVGATALSDREFDKQLLACLPKLRLYCYKFVSPQEVDDLVNDVVVIALRNKVRFDGRNMGGWLNTIAKNCFLSDVRRPHHRVVFVDPGAPGPLMMAADHRQDQHTRLYCKQALDMMPKLSKEMNEALEDAILGLTEEEVAAKRQILHGTAKSRLSRARTRMAELDGDLEACKLRTEQRLARNARQNRDYRLRKKAQSDKRELT